MRLRVVACSLLAALVVAGCGLGAGDPQQGTQLVVTDDFGSNDLLDAPQPHIGGADTVMRLLQRNAKVSTRYGGGYVQSIDGKAGGTSGGRPVDWFYYVNGVLAPKGAAATKVRHDDVVWWDRHDWGSAGDGSPAVVGSFPEPFTHGIDGRKLPVRLECLDTQDSACDAVQKKLTDVGVLAAKGGVQTSFTKDTLRIIVGPYKALRDETTVRTLEKGPKSSGVYARPTPDGSRIDVLDARGRVARRLGAGSGLVAATRLEGGQPVWIVTGTDSRGVASAASALDEATLKDHFALAIADDQGVSVPATPAP